jgi:nucleotide-binding universal stress UspA family protein
MATILCAVDGSPGAREALRTATALSDTLGLRLVLAHVAKRIRRRDGLADRTDTQTRVRAASLLADLCEEHGLDGRAERRVEVGDCATQLARIAAEEAAAVIVLGSRGERRLRLGSVSDLAMELRCTTGCPVVVVLAPPGARLSLSRSTR